MLSNTLERKPFSFIATNNQTGPIALPKVSAISVMGMQAIQLWAFYQAPGPIPVLGSFPTVEFGVDGVNWAPPVTIFPVPASGGRLFQQNIDIGAAKFVRVTLFPNGATPLLSNVQVTPFTACAC